MTTDHAALRAAAETWPEIIWLQSHDEELVTYADAKDSEITWCVDHINSSDIKYVRADLMQSLLDEIAELKTRIVERNFCERCGKRLGGAEHIHTCTPPGIVHTGAPVPDWPESVSLADLDYAKNVPEGMDQDVLILWQQLQVAHQNMTNMRSYVRQLRHLLSGGSIAAPKGASNG